MTNEQFHAYMSLFRSRSDVYARFWQKGAASGYSPAYDFNWQEFNTHRAGGGSLKDFGNKKTAPLTKGIFLEHVRGQLAMGVFPILPDNTCYFLAADFDGSQWLPDCKRYIEACQKLGLQAHLERSKSGKGGHVWIFFEEAYSCYKARRIGLSLIQQTETHHSPLFGSGPSFDRLFPNQDLLPSGGYGNLIALPLQGQAVAKGNTVFLDLATTMPYANQWKYVQNIVRHTRQELDLALEALQKDTPEKQTRIAHIANSHLLTLTVSSHISLPRRQLTPAITLFLREKLNFLSAEYLTKKRLGKPTYDVQKYFQLIEETATEILIPRGFLHQLTTFLAAQQIAFAISYRHATPKNCTFHNNIILTTEQERIVKASLEHKQGVIVAPPGSGKTMMALELIARRQKPALVLVHRKQLLDQWIERIQTHLTIPKTHIGIFSGSAKRVGTHITVGSLQTLARVTDWEELSNTFGTIIIDECHHLPAKTFRAVMSQLNPEFLYGLTATPKRKHNDESLLYAYLGDIIAKMEPPTIATPSFEISVRKTALQLPFQWQTDQFELLAKVVCFDTSRNRLIIEDILEQVTLRRKVLVLSERKEHLNILELYLKGKCETLLLTGDDTPPLRASKIRRAQAAEFQVLLSTGQFFGEGLDIDTIESLVLAFPFSFEGKLIQYTGRLAHSRQPKALIDYHDNDVAFLDRQFKQRKKYYKKVSPVAIYPKFTPQMHHACS